MPNRTLLLSLMLLAGAGLLVRLRLAPPADKPRASTISEIELTPMCPWREPARDLSTLFPSATHYVKETRILSGVRTQLQRRLGRFPGPEENSLLIHRVRKGTALVGSVLVRRVKGEHGGVEIVTAVHPEGTIRAVSVQSLREPESIANAITAANWLASFAGKNANSPLRLREDLPDVPAEARATAEAIADGVRSQLILLSFADQLEQPRKVDSHHHE